MKNTILRYHSTWIAAAEDGEITWKTASMLIEAFDLGVSETEEILRNSVVHSPSISEQSIEIKNDTFQYLENIGKPIKFPPVRLQDNGRFDKVVVEISETINFKARNRHKQLKIEV
ncbi:hypothetical protein L8R84_05645 [Vibrio splendidus]|uniref:hypothetical protein n=1 Tax=Vibrio splendidus TaxID=29497 RepID=UPI00246874DD|nr:hypothetical protein [Vibrio splendidus]MDH5935623.1 hypothetical protein [Vibrio splendidus]